MLYSLWLLTWKLKMRFLHCTWAISLYPPDVPIPHFHHTPTSTTHPQIPSVLEEEGTNLLIFWGNNCLLPAEVNAGNGSNMSLLTVTNLKQSLKASFGQSFESFHISLFFKYKYYAHIQMKKLRHRKMSLPKMTSEAMCSLTTLICVFLPCWASTAGKQHLPLWWM